MKTPIKIRSEGPKIYLDIDGSGNLRVRMVLGHEEGNPVEIRYAKLRRAECGAEQMVESLETTDGGICIVSSSAPIWIHPPWEHFVDDEPCSCWRNRWKG